MYKEKESICKKLAATLILVLSQSVSYAQPKSLGASFSFSGLALCYEHTLSGSESFIEVSAKAETSGFIIQGYPGAGLSGAISWNFPIKEWKSLNNNRILLFAGPGFICGYGLDTDASYGTFLGLEGRVGVECSFDRNIAISAVMSPVIGSHLEIRQDNHVMMKYYRRGLIYGMLPEIGIKYRF